MASWCENMALPPRVLIGPRPSGANGQGNILSIRHPKLEEETQYLFIDGQLHEFNWFKERYGSWFLGDYVCEDGSVYYCTLVDPIFVLLPLFEAARMSVRTNKDKICGMWFSFRPILLNLKANPFPVLQSGKDLGKFRQLDEILYIEGYPGYQHLMSIAGNHMELVCEVKGRSLAYMLCFRIKTIPSCCFMIYY
ncbi:hypothetical protein ACQ4PT_029496 [Festuca glaucescens]